MKFPSNVYKVKYYHKDGLSWMKIWFKNGAKLEYLVPNSKESEVIVYSELNNIGL